MAEDIKEDISDMTFSDRNRLRFNIVRLIYIQIKIYF